MVRSYGEETNEIAIAKARSATCLSNAQRVERIDPRRRRYARNFLPLDAGIPVDLIPGELPELVERIQYAGALGLVESEQVPLEHFVI